MFGAIIGAQLSVVSEGEENAAGPVIHGHGISKRRWSKS
jgi:hypothetical protein